MSALQAAKRLVFDYYEAFDAAEPSTLPEVLRKHITEDYAWRGVHPFGELEGAEDVVEEFWAPTRRSFGTLQRRPDVFLAGTNAVAAGEEIWVCQMGHLLGLFDRPWLGIPPTRRMCLIRYAEFHQVDSDHIAQTALFVDVISVMRQAGHYPLPPSTGAAHIHPGPCTHDGIQFGEQDPVESEATLALVERMIADLSEANAVGNRTGDNRMPKEVMAETWHEDMIWWGPEGIGSTYTIDRYQQQHQYPFRVNLGDKRFNGHVARFAEGNYACFFGWANLTNTPTGGFLGLPRSTPADMRVVDVYRRDGARLAEDWVFVDLLHWLDQQGIDVLARMRQLTGQEEL